MGTAEWDQRLTTYLGSVETLKARYAQERLMALVPIQFPDGTKLTLTPGGQNVLIQKVLEEFAPRFTPGAQPVYVGDAGDKFAFLDENALHHIGIENLDQHGKMPDILIFDVERNWLVIVEAVTSHGPVNPKRHQELKEIFSQSSAGLVFVTAFLSRQAMVAYLSEIAWETEVWVADDPSHLIHFDGERYLGPFELT